MREIQSLARGLKILDMIANAENGQTVTQLAELLEIDKSSVSRLLSTLESYGYVQQGRNSRAYSTGKRLHTIGWQLTNRYSLREAAKPYLHRLAETTGECAHIGVYSAGKALITDDIQPETSLLRVVGKSGRLIHLHNTAVGKSLIAFGDYPIPDELPQVTARTIINREDLIHHLEGIRQVGYSLDDEENEPGVRCIAAPVFDAVGIPLATIGISGPTIRVLDTTIGGLAQIVRHHACELSRELGYDGGFPGEPFL